MSAPNESTTLSRNEIVERFDQRVSDLHNVAALLTALHGVGERMLEQDGNFDGDTIVRVAWVGRQCLMDTIGALFAVRDLLKAEASHA